MKHILLVALALVGMTLPCASASAGGGGGISVSIDLGFVGAGVFVKYDPPFEAGAFCKLEEALRDAGDCLAAVYKHWGEPPTDTMFGGAPGAGTADILIGQMAELVKLKAGIFD